MASAPIRDQGGDHLITPQNAALVLIDYQPSQFATVRSMDPDLLRKNIVSTVKAARAFGLPIVHSTVNVASGQQQSTVPELAELVEDSPPIDRTSVNSWEDTAFVAAVRATGRRKLIFCALWTEVCMAFAALDALREGYEVYPVVDAIGGTSVEAHRAGIERVVQAGGVPIRLGLARVRATARLEPARDGAADRRDRAHREAAEGMTQKSEADAVAGVLRDKRAQQGPAGRARKGGLRGRRSDGAGVPAARRPDPPEADRRASGLPSACVAERASPARCFRDAHLPGGRGAAVSQRDTNDRLASAGSVRRPSALAPGAARRGPAGASREWRVHTQGRHLARARGALPRRPAERQVTRAHDR